MRLTGLVVVVSLLVGTPKALAAEPTTALTLTPRVSLSAIAPQLFLGATEEVTQVKRTTLFGLPQNMGPVDRILRGVLAAALIGIGSYRLATGEGSMGWTAAILAISAVPTLTATTGYCPIYHAAGIDWSF